MERYNIFKLIHKGLRASLYQTALQLQQTDFLSEEETEAAINSVNEIVMLFEGHADKEDNYILPAIEDYEPGIVANFENEHVEDDRLGKQLKACLQTISTATSLLERSVAGRKLNESFVEFTVFNLKHMAKEEDVINKILWRYYTDDEIKAIGRELSKAVEPWIQDFYATWMLRGINHGEAVEWMRAIEKGMPEVVFQTLWQKAEKEWTSDRFRKLSHSLTEGVLVA
jgi:hemerythrin-like domain-containing protein